MKIKVFAEPVSYTNRFVEREIDVTLPIRWHKLANDEMLCADTTGKVFVRKSPKRDDDDLLSRIRAKYQAGQGNGK